MRHSIWPWAVGIAVVLVGLAGVALILQRPAEEPAPPPAQTAEAEAEIEVASEPAARLDVPAEEIPLERPTPEVEIPEPVPQEPLEPAEPPLPELDESDQEVRQSLARLFGGGTVEELLIDENIVRHLVVTVDNLAREHVSERQRPLRPVPGRFLTSEVDEDDVDEEPVFLDADNFARYTPLVRAIENIDTRTLVESYERLYPLFREAYTDLGHPSGNFNHRLVEVIDHLLATPEVSGPIKLVRPNVLYEFEDDELEALSPGQKALIRMGPENSRTVKAKLREIRAELV
jgi:hypothetical protein